MSRQNARERDPILRVKEVLERGFADLYDAFADMDTDEDGKVSLHDFQQSIKNLEGGDAFTSDQIDTVFNKCGVDQDGLLAFKGFHDFFMGKDKGLATDTSGISSSVIPRSFEEVLMECRDAENKQKFITVPSTMQWSELRDKLKHKYGRAVNFMYEADGHTYTVRDERDFKLCWDSVEEAFVKSNPVTPSAHLQAFIMDIDPTKLTSSDRAGGLRTGRRSHLAPKKVTLGGVHDDGAAGRDGGERRRLAQEDFDKKHQFIDEMMRKTGVSDVEPSNMRKKWDRLIKECVALDQRREKAVKTDDFKKALTKLDQNMTADQMAWYIKDAEKNKCKNSAGDIMYEKYCTLKKTGMVVKEGEGLLDDEINKYSSLICKGLQDRYKTLQNAFKRIDEDKDGIISKQDFRQVLETKLKIILQRQYFDAIFTNADYKQDGYLDYEEFLDFFRKVPPSLATASATENIDAMSMPDLCKLLLRTFGGTQDVFQELDVEGDGYIDTQKLMSGFHKAGIKIGLMKVRDLVAEITGGQTDGKIDYLKLLKFASTVSQSDLHGSGVDEVGKEEARVRDKIREHYPDAKQAFHAFNTNKDGRLSEKEFFKGVDSVFSDPAEKPTMAIKNRLMNRADLDGDGFLAYHEFLARYGVKPVMRQAMSLERKVSAALQKLFPESLHKAFEEMDQNKDRYLDKEDLQTGIKKVLKITNFEKAEMDAFLDKLKLDENEKGLDFSAFLVRFGLDYRMDGRWEFRKEEKKKDTKESEEVKLFRRSMLASKWFGRGGIKAVMLRYSVLGSMYGKWDTLKQKCSQHTDQQGQGTIKRSTFQDLMKGSTGVEPNITDIQWDLFSTEFLEKHENKEKPAEGGFKFKENEVLYAKLCDHLRDNKRSLAQLMIKDFSSALRDGLKMSGLSSEDIQLLSGKSTGKSWWNKKINSVDVDKFETEFVLKEFEPELTLFRVLLVKNVWLDINRVLDSLNIAPHSSRSMISKADFIGAFERLEALKIVKKEEKDAILQKVAKDALYETEGPSVGQLDYTKNFLMRYIPNEITLHNVVYPHWEDSAEKFTRFALSDKIELSYRQFKELCNQFSFARELTSTQIETLIDVMDKDGDGVISLEEFKKRYARDEASIMDAVRQNWAKLQKMFLDAQKANNARGRLGRPDFQHVLVEARKQKILDIQEDQIRNAVLSLEAKYVYEREVLWEDWLQKYAGDYFKVFKAFEGPHPTHKLPRWDVVASCFEILESSRQIVHTRMWRFLRSEKSKTECPICKSPTCMWHKEFEPQDMVTWDEFRSVLERAGTDLEPRLLNKLLDDLDPQMHGFVHWRAFVEGRIPELRRGSSADESREQSRAQWRLGEKACGPYFLPGFAQQCLRQVLVDQWSPLLQLCDEQAKTAREIAAKERKEFKATLERALSEKQFEECLTKVLTKPGAEKILPPPVVIAGTELPKDYQPPPVDKALLQQWITSAKKIGTIAFSIKFGNEIFVDYVGFCRNYSQGDFNAERYIQRKWESIYSQLKSKASDEESRLEGIALYSHVKAALWSPEMGLSEQMVHMLLKKHIDRDEGETQGDEDAVVNYIDLCWQFARQNIQATLFHRCLHIFRQARALDKARNKKITNQEMHQVLRKLNY